MNKIWVFLGAINNMGEIIFLVMGRQFKPYDSFKAWKLVVIYPPVGGKDPTGKEFIAFLAALLEPSRGG